MNKKSKTIYIWLLFSIILWAAVTDAWGYSGFLEPFFSDRWGVYLYGYISRIVWAVPFIILINRFRPAVSFRELFCHKWHWPSFLIISAVLSSYTVIGMFVNHGGIWINPDVIIIQELIKFLIVGFVEEIVYRGFGMNFLMVNMSVRKANLFSTFFFMGVHVPAYFIRWFLTGSFNWPALVYQLVIAFLMGLVFGYLFRRSRSIIPAMLVHFWLDFISVVLIG